MTHYPDIARARQCLTQLNYLFVNFVVYDYSRNEHSQNKSLTLYMNHLFQIPLWNV